MKLLYLDLEAIPPTLSVTLEPNSNRSCFVGVVVDDSIGLEGIEDFTLGLSGPGVSGVSVGNNVTVVNIVDDDGKDCCYSTADNVVCTPSFWYK